MYFICFNRADVYNRIYNKNNFEKKEINIVLEIFTSNKYDNKIAIVNGEKKYNFCELKKIIAHHIQILKDKKENIVISTSDNFSFIVQFFASIFSLKNIFLISDRAKINNLDFDFDILDDVIFEKTEDYKFADIDINKPSINFYTSGSTSAPKIIQKSLYNLIKEGQDIIKEFDLKDKDYIVSSTTSMCHLFGMTFHLMMSLNGGFTINTKNVSYPENVNDKNTILIATPGFLNSVLKYEMPFTQAPEYIISAGSKLNVDIFKYLEKQSKIIEIYGSTESGIIAHKTHYDSDFTLFKNVCIKENDNGIEVKSEYTFDKKTTINDKIEFSGNTFKILNRTDRLYKICEKRVSAQELEEKLKNNEFVKDCYIMKYEEKLAILCALTQDGKDYLIKNNIVSLIKKLKQYLLKYSEIIPQKWKFIDEIPMTQSGKMNKKMIEHIFNINLSLPVILDRRLDKNSIIYKILFYNQCNFFKGHFPSFHIVPGIVQLFWAKEFANAHFNLNLGEGQWKRIKFSNIIEPDSIVELKLEKTEKNVEYEYLINAKKYASGVFLCENIFEKALKD